MKTTTKIIGAAPATKKQKPKAKANQRPMPDIFGQTFFDGLEVPVYPKPSTEQIWIALRKMSEIVVRKLHCGTPPRCHGIDGDWEYFFQTVAVDAWGRMQRYRTGSGPKTLEEFAYKSCEWALRDIQREMMSDTSEESKPLNTPLLDTNENTA